MFSFLTIGYSMRIFLLPGFELIRFQHVCIGAGLLDQGRLGTVKKCYKECKDKKANMFSYGLQRWNECNSLGCQCNCYPSVPLDDMCATAFQFNFGVYRVLGKSNREFTGGIRGL